MKHVLVTGMLLIALLGCQVTQERVPLKPLPEDGGPVAYVALRERARIQATVALEAFYVNKWSDLEETAKGLEQTARFLAKATEVPDKYKDTLPEVSSDLGKASVELREAAKAKDVKRTNEVFQRVNLKVRELGVDN